MKSKLLALFCFMSLMFVSLKIESSEGCFACSNKTQAGLLVTAGCCFVGKFCLYDVLDHLFYDQNSFEMGFEVETTNLIKKWQGRCGYISCGCVLLAILFYHYLFPCLVLA